MVALKYSLYRKKKINAWFFPLNIIFQSNELVLQHSPIIKSVLFCFVSFRLVLHVIFSSSLYIFGGFQSDVVILTGCSNCSICSIFMPKICSILWLLCLFDMASPPLLYSYTTSCNNKLSQAHFVHALSIQKTAIFPKNAVFF